MGRQVLHKMVGQADVELEKEACSIARITSIIGDRWTLLIVRECFLGVTRFGARMACKSL
jgi:DNA-binding HxlR family transcriptional regulator